MATRKTKAKKIGTLKAIVSAVEGLSEAKRRKVKTTGQKVAAARRKKRATQVPKVTRRRMRKAGNP